MSTPDSLHKLASESGFDIKTATRAGRIAHVHALEDLYRAHSAQRVLEELHRYLFPERCAPVAIYEWHASTIEDVAERIERALPDAPAAHGELEQRSASR
jgi:hypothetical protein